MEWRDLLKMTAAAPLFNRAGAAQLPREPRSRDDGVAASAAAFLRANRSEPFLLVASFINPHNICEWARGERLPDGDIGTPPPIDQCPPLVRNHDPQRNEPDSLALMRRSYHNTPMFPVGNFDTRKWREYVWAYYRMIEKVDALIGQVLQPLRESGQEERHAGRVSLRSRRLPGRAPLQPENRVLRRSRPCAVHPQFQGVSPNPAWT